MAERRLLWMLAMGEQRKFKSPAAAGVLAMLMALDARGRATITKAELAALVGIKERQMSTLLNELESEIQLIKKVRDGGAGKGRAPNRYEIRPDATGREVPDNWASNEQDIAGAAVPVATRNRQSSAGTEPPSAISNQQENAAQNPPQNIYIKPPVEPISETLSQAEAVVVARSGCDRPPPPAFQRVCEAVASPWLDPNKSMALVLEGAMVQRWIDRGFDEHEVIVPTVRALCERKRAPITTWKYFAGAVEQNAERLAAANSYDLKANTYDQQSTGRGEHGSSNRRRARNISTEILMRDILGDQPQR